MTQAQQENRNARALAVLRIGVGLFFLIFGEYKVFGTQFTLGGGFQFWINKFLEGGAYPFMAPMLRNFVLPHATPIAFLVAYGEFCIGLGLVLGILVRPASVGGLALMLTMLFSSDYPGAHASFWQYFGASLSHSIFALCFIAFLIGRADEVWSVTAWRASRKKARGRLPSKLKERVEILCAACFRPLMRLNIRSATERASSVIADQAKKGISKIAKCESAVLASANR